MIKRILKLIFFLSGLLLPGFLYAQTKQVASLRANSFRMFNINGDSATIFTSSNYENFLQLKIWKLNLKSEKLIMLDSTTKNVEGAQITSKGIFLLVFKGNKYAAGEYYLKFISLNGDSVSLGKINDYDGKSYKNFTPIIEKLNNGNCLIHTFFNNKFSIWETDGTVVGTKIIFSSNTNIQLLDTFQKGAILINYETNAYKLYSYSGLGFQNFISIPAITDKPWASRVFTNAKFYFSILTDSSNKTNPSSTWITDETALGTKKIYSKTLSNVVSINEVKAICRSGNGLATFRLDLQDTSYNNPYKFPLNKEPSWIENYLGGRFILVSAAAYGTEVGYFDEDDTIRLIKDLARGYSNGTYLDQWYRDNIYLLMEDEMYIPATNSLTNNDWYLYKYTPDSATSMFRLTEGANSNMFFYDSTFYWFCNKFPSFNIYKRHISDRDKPQIAKAENRNDSLIWYRQLGAFQKYYWRNLGSNSLYSNEVFIDNDGNVIAGFLINGHSTENILISSDSNRTYGLGGANIFFKYG